MDADRMIEWRGIDHVGPAKQAKGFEFASVASTARLELKLEVLELKIDTVLSMVRELRSPILVPTREEIDRYGGNHV